MNNNNEDDDGSSYVIVSDDHFSKKVKIFKNTNFSTFYQKVLEYFPRAFNYLQNYFIMKLILMILWK